MSLGAIISFSLFYNFLAYSSSPLSKIILLMEVVFHSLIRTLKADLNKRDLLMEVVLHSLIRTTIKDESFGRQPMS